jgi:hypothetical protein
MYATKRCPSKTDETDEDVRTRIPESLYVLAFTDTTIVLGFRAIGRVEVRHSNRGCLDFSRVMGPSDPSRRPRVAGPREDEVGGYCRGPAKRH